MIQNIRNAMQMAEMFQTVSNLQTGSSTASNGFSAEDMMKNMLSPEQQEMFDFYSNMFSQNTDAAYNDNESDRKEADVNGKLDESSGFKEPRSDKTGTTDECLSADLR